MSDGYTFSIMIVRYFYLWSPSAKQNCMYLHLCNIVSNWWKRSRSWFVIMTVTSKAINAEIELHFFLSLLLIYPKSVISCANNSRPNLLVYSRGLFPFKESCKPYKICVCFWHIIKFEMHSARICVKRNYMFIHNWAILIFKP